MDSFSGFIQIFHWNFVSVFCMELFILILWIFIRTIYCNFLFLKMCLFHQTSSIMLILLKKIYLFNFFIKCLVPCKSCLYAAQTLNYWKILFIFQCYLLHTVNSLFHGCVVFYIKCLFYKLFLVFHEKRVINGFLNVFSDIIYHLDILRNPIANWYSTTLQESRF